MAGWAFGEESPSQGETPISWGTWSDGAAGSPTIVGDADWGTIEFDGGDEGRSVVYDLGSLVYRVFTVTKSRYGAETGGGILNIRGDSDSFLQDSLVISWETYTTPITRNWRYVQVRLMAESVFDRARFDRARFG